MKEKGKNISNDHFNNIYKNESLYVLNYLGGKEIVISYGFFAKLDGSKIYHKCSTDFGSSGSPILSLENNKLITASDENELIMWDCNEPESIYMIKGHEKIVTAMCLIEGNKFASVAKDNSLKIWE